jgi:hypothetical protein
VGDVDSLHIEIENLNNPLIGFCFIKNIDFTSFCIIVNHATGKGKA